MYNYEDSLIELFYLLVLRILYILTHHNYSHITANISYSYILYLLYVFSFSFSFF